MKTKIYSAFLFALLSVSQIFAQDVTTVRANSGDISDNLDLKAVASIFGDSRDLEDFERRLNDPEIQISNLDLNGDNRVDYLRVIEAAEGNTHLIILQAVIGADTFQDVATIEIEKDKSNNVQVQVVGDVYMYGSNYIYEPVYVSRPYIYDVFWVNSYRPYYSPWYWGYYPTYYTYWSPYPVYRYRTNVYTHVNTRNSYNYVNVRRSTRAASLYTGRRANAFERQHPESSFTRRNNNVTNRYALEQTRAASRRESTSGTTSLRGSGSPARAQGVRTASGSGTSLRSSGNTTTTNNTRTVRSNGTAPLRSGNTPASTRPATSIIRTEATPVRSTPAPARVQATQPARQSATINRAPAVQQQPQRSYSAPAVRSNPAPAVRSTPAPAMRSTPAPSQPRQIAAPARSAGSSRRG
jgi:hypothetical protein